MPTIDPGVTDGPASVVVVEASSVVVEASPVVVTSAFVVVVTIEVSSVVTVERSSVEVAGSAVEDSTLEVTSDSVVVVPGKHQYAVERTDTGGHLRAGLQTPASTTTSATKKAMAKDETRIVKADRMLTKDRQLAGQTACQEKPPWGLPVF